MASRTSPITCPEAIRIEAANNAPNRNPPIDFRLASPRLIAFRPHAPLLGKQPAHAAVRRQPLSAPHFSDPYAKVHGGQSSRPAPPHLYPKAPRRKVTSAKPRIRREQKLRNELTTCL